MRALARTTSRVAACLAATVVPSPATAQETAPERPTPWLAEARVTVRPSPAAGRDGGAATAELRATYRFRPGVDTVRLSAIRIDGAELEITSVAGVPAAAGAGSAAPWRVDSLPGLLRVRPASPAPDTLTVAWRVRTDGDRLPLLLPATPTRPAESRVRLEVRGRDVDVAPGRAFPRLERAGDRLVGRPENLPSFLRLPRPGAVVTPGRIADGTVVLLVVAATAWWAAWRRRSRRTEAADEASPGSG